MDYSRSWRFPNIETDRIAAAKWAADLLGREDWVILDTETTGFSGNAEVIQISVIDHQGQPLLDTLVKPIGEIGAEAAAVNGITVEKCESAPTWPNVYPKLCKVVAGNEVVSVNEMFDTRMIRQTCETWQLDPTEMWDTEHTFINACAMLKYSQWVGDWNYRRGNYKWQKLPGGDHTGLGDCRAVLNVIRGMAASLYPEEGK
jgi:DNA polymerase-3 subunit epsilon